MVSPALPGAPEELLARLTKDGELLVERLDRWAAIKPREPFFYYGEYDRWLTYGEFAQASDAFAGWLGQAGVRPGERVSLFMRNQLVSAIAMFGCLKAGALYCPVNFSFTGRLLAYQLEDTRPKVLVTDRAMIPLLSGVGTSMDSIEDLVIYDAAPGCHDHVTQPAAFSGSARQVPWPVAQQAAGRPAVDMKPYDAVAIVYTSGTTGPSKGVLLPHRWINQYTFFGRLMLSEDDTVYNDLPLYHVGGAFFNVARAVWVGCRLACWDRFSPQGFWQRIVASGATTAVMLDAMIPWLMNAPAAATDKGNSLNKVHMQPLPKHHHEVARRFGLDFVTCGFGQTECGNPFAACIEELAQGEGTPATHWRGYSRTQIKERLAGYGVPCVSPRAAERKGYMGPVTPFFDAQVVDEHDQPLAAGVAGELAVRPKVPWILMREYVGKAQATLVAWRNLWFHSGDAVRREADGTFTFVDRLGDRIRVRGENLSSYLVEDLLNQHPAVQMSAAFAVPAAEGDEDDIAAYVVPRPGVALTAEALATWARQEMPKYMRPRHLRIVADLPRTPTNKVEKYKLKAELAASLEISGTRP